MLHPTATLEVINAVYRQLAKQHHPDHAGPAAQQRMAAINEAYAVLGNAEKRARYDEILSLQQGAPESRHRHSAPGRHEPQVRRGRLVRAKRRGADTGVRAVR